MGQTEPGPTEPGSNEPAQEPGSCIVNFFDRGLNNGDLSELLEAVFEGIEAGCPDITLVINSTGGRSSVGIAGYNYLSNLPVPLRTHNISMTASAAVLLYCAGDRRTATPNSHFLLHNGTLSPGSGLTLEESGRIQGTFETQVGFMQEIIANCTGKTPGEVARILRGTELLLTAPEAEAFGLVQSVEQLQDLGNGGNGGTTPWIRFVGSD
jgi:ATP-dependent protease ClpP protease subunit